MPDDKYVIPATANGGFPLPAPSDSRRVVEATHVGCAQRTRVSLPAVLPLDAVRRVFCEDCEQLVDASAVTEVRPSVVERVRALAPAMPATPSIDPRWLTLPVAAVAVWAILGLLNGEDAPAPAPAPSAAVEAPKAEGALAKGKAEASVRANRSARAKKPVPADAKLIAESTFSLALPAGWDRVKPAAGATFAAVSSDGTADATLWITNDPKLNFAAFEAASLSQLETLAGSAKVVERSTGPSVETTSVTIAPKKVAPGLPTYEVVLRGSKRNWFYLATTTQPSAPAEAIKGVELIQGSFLPFGDKR